MISHAFVSSVSRNGCPVSGHNYISFLLFQVFEGNKDSNSVFTNRLSQPIRARYIRFIPIEWHNHISMRVEIYGCPGVLRLHNFFRVLYGVSLNGDADSGGGHSLIRLRQKNQTRKMNCHYELYLQCNMFQYRLHGTAWHGK